METTDYCSYELSKQLKACGFDEPCDHFYEHSWDPTKAKISASGVYGEWDNIDAFKHNFNAIDDNRHKQSLIPYCSAPTLAHAQKWLREKKELFIEVSPNFGMRARTTFGITSHDFTLIDSKGHIINYMDRSTYSSYESALSAGISAALELIKKGE